MIYSEIVAGEIRKASVLYGVYRVCLSIIICKVQFGLFFMLRTGSPLTAKRWLLVPVLEPRSGRYLPIVHRIPPPPNTGSDSVSMYPRIPVPRLPSTERDVPEEALEQGKRNLNTLVNGGAQTKLGL